MDSTQRAASRLPTVPDPPLELVCTLDDHPDVLGHRLVCRRTFHDLSMDYHLAIDKKTSKELDRLLHAQPFRRLRLDRRGQAALSYAGVAANPTPDDRSDDRSEIYLLLTDGRSRRKVKLVVPHFVMLELEWVAALEAHALELARLTIEA